MSSGPLVREPHVPMRTRLPALVIFLGALALVGGCGGSSAPARESQGKAQMDCLRAKSLEPAKNDDLAFEVRDKFFRYGATDASSETKVEVFVFDDHDKALANRVAITLQNKDNNRNQVVDNTLVSYSQVPSAEFSGVVSSCVSPSSADGT